MRLIACSALVLSLWANSAYAAENCVEVEVPAPSCTEYLSRTPCNSESNELCEWDSDGAFCKCSSPGVMEAVFVMDSSNSVKQHGWNNEVELVANLIETSVSTQSKVGVVMFEDTASIRYRMTEPQDQDVVIDYILNLDNPIGEGIGTATRAGLNRAIEIYDEVHTPGYPRVLFLITDGLPYPRQEQNPCQMTGSYANPAKQTRDNLDALNVTVIIIGVGHMWDPYFLDCLVDDTDTQIIESRSFNDSDLSQIRAATDSWLCQNWQTVTNCTGTETPTTATTAAPNTATPTTAFPTSSSPTTAAPNTAAPTTESPTDEPTPCQILVNSYSCSSFDDSSSCNGESNEKCEWDQSGYCKCSSAADQEIVFVMDSSNSLKQSGWEAEEDFVISLIETGVTTQSKVGVVKFEKGASIEYTFADSQDKQDVIDAIDALENPTGDPVGTSTFDGLKLARTIFEGEHTPGLPRLLFLVTDGMPYPRSSQDPCDDDIPGTTNLRQDLDDMNVTIIIIGIGHFWNPMVLKCLVDDPDTQIIEAASFNESDIAEIRDATDSFFCEDWQEYRPCTDSPTTGAPTTESPTTTSPTTASPTTAAPTTDSPTTTSPTTESPTTTAPTTASPTTSSPTTASPTTTSPTTSSPTTSSPTTSSPTTDSPTTSSPTTSEPTPCAVPKERDCDYFLNRDDCNGLSNENCFWDETNYCRCSDLEENCPWTVYQDCTESPTTESPTTTAPTTASPTTSSPTTGSPTTASPTTSSPTTASPTTDSPTTDSPTTDSPTTDSPTTDSPTTDSPTTDSPTTDSPTTDSPTTDSPTTDSPTTDSPTTDSPTTDSPTTDSPTTDSPTTDSPTTDSPTTDSPTTDSPTTDSPTTDSPTTDSPTTDSPTTDSPTTDSPTTDSPTTDSPTTDSPTTDSPTTVHPTDAPTSGSPTTDAPTGSPLTDSPTPCQKLVHSYTCSSFDNADECNGQSGERCEWDVAGDYCMCASAADQEIVFVMDSSNSLKQAGWEAEEDFVISLIETGVTTESKVGVVKFEEGSTIEYTFSDSQDKQDVIDAIDALDNPTGDPVGTYTFDGLKDALTVFQGDHTPGLPRVMFLITDGRPYPAITQNPCDDDIPGTVELRQDLDDLNVTIIIIGIGHLWNPMVLKCLVDDPDTQILEAKSFNESDIAEIRDATDSFFCEDWEVYADCTDSPTTASPTTDAPTTDSPTTDSPTTVHPTDAPTTDSPTTDSPTTDSPTTDSPTTDSPTTDSPTTDSPTTDSPTTDSPTTDSPTTDSPTTDSPTTDSPTTDSPTTDSPTIDDSTDFPTTGSPTPCDTAVVASKSCSSFDESSECNEESHDLCMWDDDGDYCMCAAPGDMEVVFVMDSSNSLKQYGWMKEKEFVTGLVETAITDTSYVGIVQFELGTEIKHRFTDPQGKDNVIATLDSMDNPPGDPVGTYTREGLEDAVEIFQEQHVDDLPRLLFLVTDGLPYPRDMQDPCAEDGDYADEALALREDLIALEVTVIVIGIGHMWNPMRISCLVDDPDSQIIQAASFNDSDIEQIRDQTDSWLCQSWEEVSACPTDEPLETETTEDVPVTTPCLESEISGTCASYDNGNDCVDESEGFCYFDDGMCTCDDPAPQEIVFVMDASNSVRHDGWNNEKDFVVSIIDQGVTDDSYIGLVTFELRSTIQHTFDKNQDREKLKADIEGMQQTPAPVGTATLSALEDAVTVIKRTTKDLPRMIMLITDGLPYPRKEEDPCMDEDDSDPFAVRAKKLRKNLDELDATVIVIGVGHKWNPMMLSCLVDDVDTQIIEADSFEEDDLAAIRDVSSGWLMDCEFTLGFSDCPSSTTEIPGPQGTQTTDVVIDTTEEIDTTDVVIDTTEGPDTTDVLVIDTTSAPLPNCTEEVCAGLEEDELCAAKGIEVDPYKCSPGPKFVKSLCKDCGSTKECIATCNEVKDYYGMRYPNCREVCTAQKGPYKCFIRCRPLDCECIPGEDCVPQTTDEPWDGQGLPTGTPIPFECRKPECTEELCRFGDNVECAALDIYVDPYKCGGPRCKNTQCALCGDHDQCVSACKEHKEKFGMAYPNCHDACGEVQARFKCFIPCEPCKDCEPEPTDAPTTSAENDELCREKCSRNLCKDLDEVQAERKSCSAKGFSVDKFGCGGKRCQGVTCADCGSTTHCVKKCDAYKQQYQLSDSVLNCDDECQTATNDKNYVCFNPCKPGDVACRDKCTARFCDGKDADTSCSALDMLIDPYKCGGHCQTTTCGACGNHNACLSNCGEYNKRNGVSLDCEAECAAVGGRKCFSTCTPS